ncbi:disulfide bond formation protein DsbB [Colwellia sp. 4_MG-2023]|uniref:disulfide bond formation protein DsbB n=1 Tax=unclassified Colwellia TaxID=196834 RepID=UPI0026E12FD9|nr:MULTISPECIES: disulfide bond formation protein DsbB [unclassified Colwellia]MDO6487489.1 disulfide bond formation protein DsbB [Colwellia sp. 6_MG-2023]MDO6507601.1 disulfide bond formation protein DsbB [Colwellia sp. 5_MG-2023]MDO6556436.1 disulfide bond formation protein DsbB [Colwellia sp. 4_MG-2023]
MKFLSDLTTRSKSWLLLTISALAFELCALYFQYAMDLAPCIMCVYQRLAICAIIIAGVIGIAGSRFLLTRIIAYALWGVGAIWGLLIALEHIEMQSNSGSLFFSCEFVPNFPTWAPLHEWLPFLFEATGSCGDIDWQFLGYSMPQWMTVVFGFYTIAFGIILLNRLIHSKKL